MRVRCQLLELDAYPGPTPLLGCLSGAKSLVLILLRFFSVQVFWLDAHSNQIPCECPGAKYCLPPPSLPQVHVTERTSTFWNLRFNCIPAVNRGIICKKIPAYFCVVGIVSMQSIHNEYLPASAKLSYNCYKKRSWNKNMTRSVRALMLCTSRMSYIQGILFKCAVWSQVGSGFRACRDFPTLEACTQILASVKQEVSTWITTKQDAVIDIVAVPSYKGNSSTVKVGTFLP